ncbi:WD40 repeat domain-containing protein [Saccharothrix luteola]|uniref:WD40 repeat domain-containing protein n=1 Tax=Saccharothrix luteola TaxID=2893018 RepID=UPI001E3039E8|nr:WD40 repeat domain-containing protein [Saccharothrix luteola]MCC8242825.1 WD40 repeat domain-containing protein [Saccharothrix luteola]
MPRPERELAGSGPVESLAAGLRELRRRAGSPGYRELAARSGFSASTLANAAGGRSLPTLTVTLAYVRVCDGDPILWEQRWRQAAAESAASRRSDDGDPPYRGLLGYGVGDGARFFGRDAMVAQLVRLVERQRFVAVFGTSGSGKSSLLHAGLIPALTAVTNGDGGGPPGRPVVLVTPGRDPEAAAVEAIGSVPAGSELVLVVDQFEEVFTHCPDPVRRRAFVDRIAGLVTGPDPRATVVLGIRADFYARCADLPVLAGLLAGASVPVPTLTEDELRDVVTKPAALVGLTVERALVTKILAEASGQPGALPLLSHALLETWRQRRGDVLGVAGYEATGGVAGAVARTAETLYDGFDDEQRETARQVLVRLVAFGEGVEDTRRRVPRDELDLPGIDPVLARLAEARLVVLGEDTVEIAHEAVIRAWPRLRRWLSTDRDGLRIHRQLGEAAQSWMSLDRDPGALYRGARLAVAREWAARNAGPVTMTAAEQEFLATSIDLADRERADTARRHRQLRYLVVALSVLLVAAVSAGTVALVQRRDAVAQRQTATSRQLAAESLGLAGTEPGTAMLLAAQAYRSAPTTEARGALLSMSPHRGHLGKLLGHSGAVSQIAYHRDGNTLLSVGRDQTLSLWASDRRVRTAALTGHHTWLTAAAVSPDGRTAVTGGEDTQLAIWDLDRRVRVATLAGVTERVRDIAFSPDGTTLATTADNDVILWDMARHTRSATLSGHAEPVHALAFSPDGRTIATASADSTVILWDVTRSVALATLTGHTDGAYAVAFSPDGATLATGSGDTTATVWDVPTGTRLTTFTHHRSGLVMALAFSPDGRTLATAGDDTAVLLWDTRHRVLRGRLTGPRTTVYTMAFNPRTSELAAGGEDGAILLWDPDQPAVAEHPGMVSAVAFSPDGRTIATAGGNRTTLWNTADRSVRAVLTDGEVFTNAAAFSPDGRLLATATQPFPCCPDGVPGNTLTLWDLDTGTPVRRVGHTGQVLSVAFSPDGRRVATAGVDRTVFIRDTATGTVLKSFTGHAGAVNGVRFSPDGRLLATASHDQTVKLWDPATGTPLATLTGHTGWIRTAEFSPDGRTLATAGHDQTVILWDVTTRTRLDTITDHTDADFTGVAFSPDGRTLAYTSGDAAIALWDVSRRTTTARLTGHTQRVHAIAFSPDGHHLATAGADQNLILWDVDPERAITHVCAAAGRDLTPDEWRRYLPSTPYARTCADDQ